MRIRERVLEVLYDLILGFHGGRTIFSFACLGRWLGAQNRGAEDVIHCRDVLDLGPEVSDALKLALAGSKRELVGGHGFGSRDKLTFDAAQLFVQHGGKRGLGFRLGLSISSRKHTKHTESQKQTANCDSCSQFSSSWILVKFPVGSGWPSILAQTQSIPAMLRHSPV